MPFNNSKPALSWASRPVFCWRDWTSMNHTKEHGEVSAGHGTKSRGGFNSLNSLDLRHLCLLGTTFAIVMGLLSRSYFELSFRDFMEQRSDLKLQSFIDVAASARSLKISEEDSVETLPSPNELRSGESFQVDNNSSTEQDPSNLVTAVNEKQRVEVLPDKSDSIRDEEQPKVGLLTVSVVEQTQTHQELQESRPANQSTTYSTEDEVAESQFTTQEERQLRLEQLRGVGMEQNEEPGIILSGMSGEDDLIVESKEVLKRSPVERIVHRSDSSASSSVRPSNSSSTKGQGQCDLSAGKWVHDPSGPLYRSDQCPVLSQPQNCQFNGRPDHEYEFYKWEPDQCSLPRFDPIAFLELMQGKTLAFVGDSLARNQMESLMCILLQVEKANPKGSRDMHRWYFPSHKFTVVRMWSSWLVQTKGEFPPSVAPPDATKLNLTELDDYAYHLPKFDVLILSSGHWWVRKTAFFMNGELLGGMGWPWQPSHGPKKMDHTKAFGVAMNTALQRVGAHPGYKGLTILRTFTPDHYSGGSWDTGGSCTGESKPYDKGPSNRFNELMHQIQLKAFKSNTKRGAIMPNGSKLKLLDTYPMLNYRGDGHPGPYRNNDPSKKTTRDAKGRPPPQDCLHWCMPGPIDSTNDLLFQTLREEMK